MLKLLTHQKQSIEVLQSAVSDATRQLLVIEKELDYLD